MDRGRTKIPTLYKTDLSGCHIAIQSNQQKGQALQDYFCPSSNPTEPNTLKFVYLKPAFKFMPITNEQIDNVITGLSPMKALGPNGIGNIIFKQCQNLLMLHLGPIFWAMFSIYIYHYPHSWKESKMVVLQKPNKLDYMTLKAYQPIALLDTMSKILRLCVARTLTNKSKQHKLLEKHQFGARLGQTIMDVFHMLTGFEGHLEKR